MKKRVIVAVSIALVSGVLMTWLLCSPPSPGISLTLVNYTQWPHGAMLRLSNSTPRTITCAAEAILYLEKTRNGWTNTSPAVKSVTVYNPTAPSNKEVFVLIDSTSPPKAGDHLFALATRELKPGRSCEFWVQLEPGALPKRVGTVCSAPSPGKLMSKLRPWVDRLRRWARMKPTTPGLLEIWCSTPLSAPAVQPVDL